MSNSEATEHRRGTGAHLFALLLTLAAASPSLPAASHDNNIEWDGVYSSAKTRSPPSPAIGQPFAVELRVFHDDITAARVRAWDGAETLWPMTWLRSDGPYDVWGASLTGTTKDFIYYRFEITDGTDTDYYNALGMWEDTPPAGDFLIITTPMATIYPLGATPRIDGQSGVTFRVWAPDATSATVAGEFNSWNVTANPLRNIQGYWEGQIATARTGHKYKFVFNGNVWRTDPRARRQENSVKNSVVVDPRYNWGDDRWKTPAVEDMIIYELHVGSFSGLGDGVSHVPGKFRDVIDAHLDHLVSLGVNAVELMPVSEFAGDRSWGYNPAFQYAPESAYGAPEDLKYLVDRCHQAGIAVLFDVVYNHMGPGDLANNLLQFDGPDIYFYPTTSPWRETPWGPRPDYSRVEVRDYIAQNVRYWLEEYHGDGLRVDATDFIKVNADGWRLLRAISDMARETRPGAVVIAEQLPNDPAVTRPIAQGGAGMKAQWHDAFHDNLRSAINAAAFGDPNFAALASAVNHFAYPADQVVNYIESHDEAATLGRVAAIADISNPESVWANGRSRFAAALVLFSAGIPMLLQGQEFLENRSFGDGDDRRILWTNVTKHAGFLRFMKDAVALRRTHAALRATAAQNVFHVSDTANVLAIHRSGGGDDLVVILSLANSDLPNYDVGFPAGGAWYEVLNGDSSAYGGQNHGNGGQVQATGAARHGFAQSARILIPRMGVLVFSRTAPPNPEGFVRGDANGDRKLEVTDAILSLGILFQGVKDAGCLESMDVNGDALFDISDPVSLLSFLFTGGLHPKDPWPACGPPSAGSTCAFRCE